jgi:uncharacterized OsmC-like protein
VAEKRERSVVVRSSPEKFAQDIEAGRHTLRSDEPEDLGGKDTGPTPYDYLLAALGSCTSMTLRMYADRKGWPLEGVRVWLKQGKIHARDCEDCETAQGKIDRIEKEIEVLGPLTEEQRQRLLEIADMCPVHRTLQNEVSIRSRLI